MERICGKKLKIKKTKGAIKNMNVRTYDGKYQVSKMQKGKRNHNRFMAVVVLLTALMAVSYIVAILNYRAVENCAKADKQYFSSHNCSNVLK